MFGSRGSRPKTEFYEALRNGDPITPRHDRPAAIGDSYSSSYLVADDDRRFFEEFFDFGDVLNWWFADDYSDSRWRIQELSTTELMLGFHEDPSFGRRYEAFCGPTKLGLIEISGIYTDEREVLATVELRWIRLLNWDTVVSFLDSLALHIDQRGSSENKARIQSAMNRSLWDSLMITDGDEGLDWGTLDVTLIGSADFYFARRNSEHFRQKIAQKV